MGILARCIVNGKHTEAIQAAYLVSPVSSAAIPTEAHEKLVLKHVYHSTRYDMHQPVLQFSTVQYYTSPQSMIYYNTWAKE